jgi:hypothetical protein
MNYRTAIDNKKNNRKNELLLAERLFVNTLKDHPVLRDLEKERNNLILKKESGEAVDSDKIKALEKQQIIHIKQKNYITSLYTPVK